MKTTHTQSAKAFSYGLLLTCLLALPSGASAERPYQQDNYDDRPRYEQQGQQQNRGNRRQKRHDQLMQMRNTLDVMQNFFGIINSMHEVASDSEKAVIYQMHEMQEIYKKSGNGDELVKMLEGVLEQTSNQTIRNVAYAGLSEALKKTGRSQRAVEVLQDALSENLKKIK